MGLAKTITDATGKLAAKVTDLLVGKSGNGSDSDSKSQSTTQPQGKSKD